MHIIHIMMSLNLMMSLLMHQIHCCTQQLLIAEFSIIQAITQSHLDILGTLAEMADGRLEEVFLCRILQESVLKGISTHLKREGGLSSAHSHSPPSHLTPYKQEP